jgi:hypothetical protein
MTHSLVNRTIRMVCILTLLAGASVTGLSGCDGFNLPPIPVAITIVNGAQIVAADQTSGSVDIPLTIFCDLFSEERLDELLTSFGGADIAALVDVPSVVLDSLEVVATQGNFANYTSGSMDMTLIDAGADPLDLGSVTDSNGLGTGFELMPEMTLDLLNDLDDDQCGVPALHLDGATPTEDVEFQVIANVLVYTRINLQ